MDLAARVKQQVAAVLRVSPQLMDVDQPLNTMGLDSLMAMDLRNRIRSELHADVPMVKFLAGLSVTALVAEIAAVETPAPARNPADVLGRLDQLTDQEIDALLASTLAEEDDG